MVSKYRDQKEYRKALKFADLILQVNPKSGVGLVQKGALSSWIAYEILETAKSGNRDLSEKEEQEFNKYNLDSKKYIDAAITLGWQPESTQSKQKYLNTIEDERTK